MAGATLAAAGIGAAATAYGAYENRKAAEKAAKGSQVKPWGRTSGWMDKLLGDAYSRFNHGQFQFGPAPQAYDAYLNFGRNMGLDLGDLHSRPAGQAGYGPGAYEWMLNLVQGPAWAGASRTNPNALLGQPNPVVAGLMGGLGSYAALGGFGTPSYGLGGQYTGQITNGNGTSFNAMTEPWNSPAWTGGNP